MTRLRHFWQQLVIIGCCLAAAALSHAQSAFDQSLDTQNRSAASTALMPLQTVAFLPVNEAYQLNPELISANRLNLHWTIADGYYLYRKSLRASMAASGQNLQLDLPTGTHKYDEYFEEEVEVYYHQLTTETQLPTLDAATPIRIAITSQGCADAGLCYPPQTQIIAIEQGKVTLIEAASSPANAAGAKTPASTANNLQNSTSFSRLLIAMFSAMLGGLLLNLMPCVFPVLSLKALSLANSHQQPHRQHLHGWSYTLGAVTLFVVIAAIMLTLRQAGHAIGWGFQLQSPLVTGGLAYLFFAMALLLSGRYSLGSSFSGIGQKLTEGHSLKSSFFTGALACIVASPCTAPFMGGALGYAITQPAHISLGIFAALGFGMALPFLLLSYYPSLSRHLPKPGQWMETFRQFLAFPLYLTALWLLWVLGRQAGSDAIILLGTGAVALAFAIWLLQLSPPSTWRRLLALAMLLLALLPFSKISSLNSPPVSPLDSSSWQPYTEQRLQQLLDNNTPVFVNLTADWCITCLANEKAVLSRASIEAAFEQAGVVKIKGDWTNYNAEITQLLNRFGRNGVPLYLLYSGREGEPPVILPQILSEKTLQNALAGINNRLKAEF